MKSYIKNYPRPQFVRNNWVDLNGEWDFAFDEANKGEKEEWYLHFPSDKKIIVPFTYETKLSGIGDEKVCENVWYKRNVTVTEDCTNKKVLLHFEGSDYTTKVWVNGQFVGLHHGGYARFTFDIARYLVTGENTIVVKVEDDLSPEKPRGKQRWISNNFGCWYVQTTGIWKTVWMEYVPVDSLVSVKMTPVLEDSTLEVALNVEVAEYKGSYEVEMVVEFEGKLVNAVKLPVLQKRLETKISVASLEISEWGVNKWSPENPNLYDITFRLVKDAQTIDEVDSYFGMREIRIKGNRILLNGAPLYQRLILDQGYWKDSHLTPPDEEALIKDIDSIRALGYNGLRKHQKTEDERFLYWCDVKGMLVWCEMPSPYVYSDDMVDCFTKEWTEIVRQNYNHPSIITWTPVNESWGVPMVEVNKKQQAFTEAIYYLTKSLDSMRPVIVNDGWEHTISDILTIHDYEELGSLFEKRYIEHKEEILRNEIYPCGFKGVLANGYEYKGQPILISEYGGIAFNNDDSGWGYGNKVQTEEDFIKRFEAITLAIKKVPYVCGFCYTQVTDVQQEINGLMDIDRNFKVDKDAIKEINLRSKKEWTFFN
jgi:beta-galactosidase/beta-glucuronidase